MSDWGDLSVPGGAGPRGRWDRDLVVAGVRHAATRGLTLRAAVTAVAAEAEVSERTLWRWLARVPGEEPDPRGAPPRTTWSPTPAGAPTPRLHGGNGGEAGADVPGLRTFQEGIAAALSPGQRAGLRTGERARREYDAYLRWEPEGRNDLWEADHKQLDIDVRARGFDRPVRPWITLFVEAYSRVVPGWALSVQPSSASILAAFGSAVAVTPTQPWGGIPVRLRVDRGADFLSNALRDACGRLGVVLDPAPPDVPLPQGQGRGRGQARSSGRSCRLCPATWGPGARPARSGRR